MIAENFNENEFLEQAQDFQLVYLFSERPMVFVNQHIIEVDQRITYQKNVQKVENQSGIKPYDGPLTDKLLQLAFQSGEYSRFKIDSMIGEEKFKSLYRIWISKGIESKAILTTEGQTGMITYTLNEEHLCVGLLAVNQSARGKGLGKKLMSAVEQKAFELGKTSILVPTQEANLTACKFYQSLGYYELRKVFVYHYWRA